jgi:hypothetical protein
MAYQDRLGIDLRLVTEIAAKTTPIDFHGVLCKAARIPTLAPSI